MQSSEQKNNEEDRDVCGVIVFRFRLISRPNAVSLNSVWLLDLRLCFLSRRDVFASMDALGPRVIKVRVAISAVMIPRTTLSATSNFAFLVGDALGAHRSGCLHGFQRGCGEHVNIGKDTQRQSPYKPPTWSTQVSIQFVVSLL